MMCLKWWISCFQDIPQNWVSRTGQENNFFIFSLSSLESSLLCCSREKQAGQATWHLKGSSSDQHARHSRGLTQHLWHLLVILRVRRFLEYRTSPMPLFWHGMFSSHSPLKSSELACRYYPAPRSSDIRRCRFKKRHAESGVRTENRNKRFPGGEL